MTAPLLLSSPIEQAFQRASNEPDYFGWLDHIASAAGCSHPIRLAGRITTIHETTGVSVSATSTEYMPDGVIYKNCGNRRASVCPSCSTTYRRDAYQLIRTDLTGGKGIPASVAGHPAVFATFTAPGFGPVHTRRTSKTGQPIPCRPCRDQDRCPHGIDLRCDRLHAADEKTLGTPLCLNCYDHAHQERGSPH
jgi:Replication initiator protein, pSAM2